MRRDTIFRVASMTKPITSALILMLVEEGKLRLHDPIVKWAPELANRRVLKDPTGPIDDTYPAPRDITIEDLLTHRSGLAEAFTSRGAVADAYERAVPNSMALTPEEFLAALATLPLNYSPGERWLYGYSTTVLGVLAERIAGKPFRDLMLDRILTAARHERHGLLDPARETGPRRRRLLLQRKNRSAGSAAGLLP
jgi:CubicO group peptidase (beta-lactamase class C family)